MLKTLAGLATLLLLSVTHAAQAPLPSRPPIESSVIYEVNIRQHTPEGTFDAFREDIPRLKAMGVGVLWLMPIHPIGALNRKGTLGSYYSVRDYTEVNPEFGSKQDFDELVSAAHDAGMLVILDWVANHTSWDHVWTETHPDRFQRTDAGAFTTPNEDWLDVIQLDLRNADTRRAMTDAMLYWVREHDIDGYRCDVAELVPRSYWNEAISALRDEKPVFMLAEGGSDWLYDVGFDATYGWALGDSILRVVNEEADVNEVWKAIMDAGKLRGERHPFRMHFTTNHDWNSWNGTAVERFGEAWEAATVLTFTAPGMPLIYSGQEAGLDRQLEFFEKDPIEWREHPARVLYERLGAFKNSSPALRHADPRARIRRFRMAAGSESIIGFERRHPEQTVVVFVNLSDEPVPLIPPRGEYQYFDLEGQNVPMPDTLDAWGWVVLERL